MAKKLPNKGTKGPSFTLTPMSPSDRRDIVQLSGAPGHSGTAFVQSHQFELGSLGADLDLDGKWGLATGIGSDERHKGDSPDAVALPWGGNIAAWRQITTSGRDQYVRIVHRGYLFPLGLRAIFVDVYDRVFIPDPVSPTSYTTGYLQRTSYIKILELTKTYPALGQPFNARSWPFTSLTALTPVSPPLNGTLPQLISGKPQAVLPQSGTGPNDDVQWTFRLVNTNGTKVTLVVPQIFVFGEDGGDPGDPHTSNYTSTIQAAYNTLDVSHRTSTILGTSIQYAPETTVTGGTTHPTLAITLSAAISTNDPIGGATTTSVTSAELLAIDQPDFYPAIGTARIRLPAAEALTRQTVDDSSGPGVAITLFPSFVTGAFAAATNKGGIYAALTSSTGLNFPGDAVGGLGNPNTALTGLSAAAGAIGGDIASYAKNAASDVADYFTNALTELPQIFGGLPFINGILGDFLGDLKTPQMTTTTDPKTGARTVTYTLQVELQQWSPGGNLVFEPVTQLPGTLTMTSNVTVAKDGKTTYKVNGAITPFVVHILGQGSALYFIDVPFNGATFASASGTKSSINVNVGQVTFAGPLSFVNALEQFLSDLGGSGFSINVTPTQIQGSLSLSLPSLSFGMFSLDNLALSAGITIPFLGSPTVANFGFCSQEQPFTLTVCMFGGGGYFLLALGLHQVQSVTASFDFEGQFGLDVIVASGSVSVKAGITYVYDATNGTTLTGFVDITGEVEVLGIISITIEVDLSLTYVEPAAIGASSYVKGTATMKLSISVLFFSVSVSATVSKQFGGSSGSGNSAAMKTAHAARALKTSKAIGPGNTGWTPSVTSFTTIMGEDPADAWTDYCGAFAG